MGNVAYDKSFEYAVEIVKLAKELRRQGEYEIISQLVRSATSIGANLSEAQYAQSSADFTAKLSIALKEASESRYWLKLMRATGDIGTDESAELISKADELIRILTASVKTTKRQ